MLIYQEVSAPAVLFLDCPVELLVHSLCRSAEPLLLRILKIEYFDGAVVEIEPLTIVCFDIAVIVPVLGPSIMGYDSDQIVDILIFNRLLLLGCFGFLVFSRSTLPALLLYSRSLCLGVFALLCVLLGFFS